MNDTNYDAAAASDGLVSRVKARQRINRIEYVGGTFIFSCITQLTIVLASLLAVNDFLQIIVGIVAIVIMIVAFLGHIFLGISRLHDLNKTGWLLLIGIIPLINLLFVLYVMFCPGTDGDNEYGSQPAKANTLLYVAAFIPLIILILGMASAFFLPFLIGG